MNKQKENFNDKALLNLNIEEQLIMYQLALKASNDGLFDWNLETNEIYYSPAWKKMLGYEDQVLPNDLSFWEKSIDPVDIKKLWELQQKLITKQIDRFDYEFKMKHKNGHWVHILSRTEVFFNDSDKAVRIIGIHTDITERKSMEMIAAKEQAINDTIIDSIPGAFFMLNENGKYVRWNAYQRDVIIGKPESMIADIYAIDTIHPDDRDIIASKIESVLSNGIALTVEARVLLHGGPEYKWLLLTGRRIVIENKPYLLGTGMDITERKLKDEEIIKTGQHYQALIEKAPDGIVLLDIDGNFKYISPAATKMFGFKLTDMVTGNSSEFTHPDDLQMVLSVFEKIFKDPSYKPTLEYRFRDKQGQWHWVETTFSNMLANPSVESIVLNFRDICERKQHEKKINLSEEKFRKAFLTSPDSININRLEDGMYISINKGFTQIMGYTEEEVYGKTSLELNIWVNVDDRKKLSSGLKSKGYVENLESRFRKKDGSLVYGLMSASIIELEGITHILSITRDITERKQAETALRLSQERFTLVMDASEQGIWDWNVATNEIFYSEQWKKQIGYTDDELKNEFSTWPDHLHPDEKLKCQNELVSYLNNPIDHFITEFRFRHKDGSYRWIHSKAASIKNLEGKVIRLFGTHNDITESKQNEAIFKDIIEKNPMSIQILDMQGYPIQINSAHTKLFGVQPPKNYSILNDSQLLTKGFDKFFEQILKGEVVYFPDTYYNVHELDAAFPDSPVWVKALGFTLNDNNGNPNKMVLMHENITDRKNAEALLNEIIENNPMSIQVVDKAGYTLRVNPAFNKLFGSVPPTDFSIFDDLSSKSIELQNLVSKVKNGEIIHLPDINFNPHDVTEDAPDNPLWIRALIFPLKINGDKPERYVFMHENISERKAAEQELIKAKEQAEESDRLKSAFLANMSHEIRTPMNGILGFSELLKEPGLSGEQQQEYIRIIEKSGTRMLNIINDIVDISKIEAGLVKLAIRESNINEQIEYIYTFFKPEVEAKGMKLLFSNSLTAKYSVINTDREKLYAILTNLVKNAVKYTENGSIEFGYTVEKSFIQFYVKDTGIGIPEDRQLAIFERFIQADIADKMARQGAGLGLSISKAYVEMLGGKIWVESEEGVGSTFYFTLPYNPSSANDAFNQQFKLTSENIQIRKLKILIAEDDEVSEMLIKIVIENFAKEILTVKSGLEAIEICRHHTDIDLILMDIQLPRMSGYEATRQIREFNKDVVILAQTAFGLSGDREKAIEAGCNDYVTKPINNQKLLALIQQYFYK